MRKSRQRRNSRVRGVHTGLHKAPEQSPAAAGARAARSEPLARQMNYYSWFVERGRASGDAFVCADPAVRHAADFERRLRRRSTQYR